MPPVTKELGNVINGNGYNPSFLDDAVREVGAPPFLANYHLATPADLTRLDIGFGEAVYIPHQISDKQGGRKSQYALQPGESVIAGLYFAQNMLFKKEVTRETGSGTPAQEGDTYRVDLKARDETLYYQGKGTLQILETSPIKGKIIYSKTDAQQVAAQPEDWPDVWFYFSMIVVDDIFEDDDDNCA